MYIVRHGQTEWNVLGKLQGSNDIPLNEKGEKQAQELAKKLNDISFDVAFSSDLLRAKRTAEIIVLEKQLAVQTTKILREKRLGSLEGQHYTVANTYNDLMKEMTEQERFQAKLPPDRESDEELINRLIPFIRETAITHPSKKVLMVTHAGVLRTLLVHLGACTYKDLKPHAVANTAYLKLDSDGVDFFVQELHGIDLGLEK